MPIDLLEAGPEQSSPRDLLAPDTTNAPAVEGPRDLLAEPVSSVPSSGPSNTPLAQTAPVAEEGGFGTAFQRGVQREQIGASSLMYMLGASDEDTFVQSVVRNKAEQDALPKSPEQATLDAELAGLSEDDWWGSAKAYVTNPKASLQAATESLPSGAASLVGAVGGGLAGSAIGPVGTGTGAIAGASLGSASSEYGSSLVDYMEKEGVNVRDPIALKAALIDPDFVNEAHWYAAKRAGAIGAFELVGGKLGGKLATKFWNPGESALRKAGGAVAGTGLDALTEGAGEASAQLITEGKIDARQVVAESLLSIPTSAADVAVGPVAEAVALRMRGGQETGPQDLLALATAEPGGEVPAASLDVPEPVSATPDVLGEASDEDTFAPTAEAVAQRMEENPIFYSAVRKHVEEKGPNMATAEQWASTISNGPVKREEIDALGLPAYLNARDGKISKKDLLTHIEDKSLRIEEIDQIASDAYGAYQAKGPRSHGRELIIRLPKQEGEDAYKSPHWDTPNALAHVRYNTRTDRDGKKTLFLEEIQSDWHQEGRREGYRAAPVVDTPELMKIEDRIYQTPGVKDDLANGDAAQEAALNRNVTLALEAGNITDAEAQTFRDYVSRLRASIRGVPDAPFKTSWPELMFKRMLRYAADKGYERVAWANGDMQNQRYDLKGENAAGMKEFYDNIIPNVAKRWSKKLGSNFGRTAIDTESGNYWGGLELAPDWADVGYIDVSPQLATNVRRGLPLFARNEDIHPNIQPNPVADALRDPNGVIPTLKRAFAVVSDMAKEMGINVPITFQIRNELKSFGYVQRHNGGWLMSISPSLHNNPAHVYSTVMHEFGHIICFEKFYTANEETKFAVKAAYDKFRSGVDQNTTLFNLFQKRSAFPHVINAANVSKVVMVRQTQDGAGYWLGFDEWFADQVARWATTKLRPVSIVDKFFSALGRQLRDFFKAFSETVRLNYQPTAAVANWLDSFLEGSAPLGEPIMTENDFEGRRQNAEDLEKAGEGFRDIRVPPRSSNTGPIRGAIRRLFGGRPPAVVNGVLASVDYYNRFYEYMLSMPQVAARNPHIRRLQIYKEDVALMAKEKSEIMGEALETMKSWQRLGGEQGDNLAQLIDGLSNMEYLTPDEVKAKRVRWPTQPELDAMVAKYGVNAQGQRVAGRIIGDFRRMLLRYEQIMLLEANKIRDPAAQAVRLEEIQKSVKNMLRGPYFPAMRFGKFTLTVRDGLGNVEHFETFEDEKTRRLAVKDIEKQMLPGSSVFMGVLPESVRPLMGMPPHLLEKISEKLALSDEQRKALDELKFELSPAQSYKHRFQRKKRVKGYSLDFKRAYANYFFHGSNHLTRVKYVDQLREHIKAVREQASFMPEGTKRGQIANFMSDHLQEMLDPKPDFAALRSLAFMWHLSFDAPAALINLMQLPVLTQPYLASKFGDLKAASAMARASTNLSTYYKQATLSKNTTDEEIMALGEAVREGIISEALAPELAALSEGRNLRSHSGKALEQMWISFKELGAGMFQLAEQTNRRVTFRAAWKLAKENPDNPYIQEVIKTNEKQYQSLRMQGWTHQNAAAFVVAKQMTENTQFVYGSHAQPKLFRGKAKSVLVFKSFIQNTLFALWNNPSAGVRSLITMAGLGGLMGLPGMEDAEDLVKSVAWQFFGKDFSIDKEVRKFVLDMTGDAEWGDLVLHGFAREGFGIPGVMDMLGVHAVPEFDQSRNIGMGQISPLDIGTMFGPSDQSLDERLGSATQTASGAAIGIPINVWKAAMDWQLGLDDPKRLERAMPGYLKSLARAYRYVKDGMERDRSGAPIVKFDTTDPKQMAEIIGVALGYTPTRLSREWDRINAEREAITYWDIRRGLLLGQMDQAVQRGDAELRESTIQNIKKYNLDLPDTAKDKRITRETIKKSLARKAQNRKLKDLGLPAQKSNRGLVRDTQELYPMGDVVEEKKVPG